VAEGVICKKRVGIKTVKAGCRQVMKIRKTPRVRVSMAKDIKQVTLGSKILPLGGGWIVGRRGRLMVAPKAVQQAVLRKVKVSRDDTVSPTGSRMSSKVLRKKINEHTLLWEVP
jgi:hypothetical protein